jgi:hypothetical protein
VIAATIATAALTLLASVVAVTMDGFAGSPTKSPETLQFLRNPFMSKIVNVWVEKKLDKFMEKVILGFSDQQVITGLRLLFVAFSRLPNGQITIDHFNIALDTAWFSANVHLVTLTVPEISYRAYFCQNNPNGIDVFVAHLTVCGKHSGHQWAHGALVELSGGLSDLRAH